MPSSPKLPLKVRLKALKEAFKWVVGNEAGQAEALRRLTLLDPSVSIQPQSYPLRETSPSVSPLSIGVNGLALVPMEKLEKWSHIASGPAQDPRLNLLIQWKSNDWWEKMSSPSHQALTKTALRMAWKNQVRDVLPLQLISQCLSWATQFHTLPPLEEAALEAALSLEENIPTPHWSLQEVGEKWNTLSNAHKSYVAHFAACLKLPGTYQHVFSTLPVATLNQGIQSIDQKEHIGWIGWNALFNNLEPIEKALSQREGVQSMGGFSESFMGAVGIELKHWQNALEKQVGPTDQALISTWKETEWPNDTAAFNPFQFEDFAWSTKKVSALHWSILFDSDESAQLLLKHGANPNFKMGGNQEVPLGLMMYRQKWVMVQALLTGGAKVIQGHTTEFPKERTYLNTPLVGATTMKIQSAKHEETLKALFKAANKESTTPCYERAIAYSACFEKGETPHERVKNLDLYLTDLPRDNLEGGWMGAWKTEEYTCGDLAQAFIEPVKIDHLKAMAKHAANLDDHLWVRTYENQKSYSSWMLFSLILWAPEALEAWIEEDAKQAHLLASLCKRRTPNQNIKDCNLPEKLLEKINQPGRWLNDDHIWTMAMRSSNPKLVLELFQKYTVPQDHLHSACGETGMDMWEEALTLKRDDYFVEWLCQTFGGPIWEDDRGGTCLEMKNWMTVPRNEREIESVLGKQYFRLDRVIDLDSQDTLLHWAIGENDGWLVQELVKNGANLYQENASAVTPQRLAERNPAMLEAIALGEKEKLNKALDSSTSSSLKKKHL